MYKSICMQVRLAYKVDSWERTSEYNNIAAYAVCSVSYWDWVTYLRASKLYLLGSEQGLNNQPTIKGHAIFRTYPVNGTHAGALDPLISRSSAAMADILQQASYCPKMR